MVQESEVRDKPTFLREHQGGSRAWGWGSERMRVEDEELSRHSWATGASLPHVQRAKRVFQRHNSVSQEEGRIQTCLVSGERSYKERRNGSPNPATAEPSTVVS